jgi:hypothetical protein
MRQREEKSKKEWKEDNKRNDLRQEKDRRRKTIMITNDE